MPTCAGIPGLKEESWNVVLVGIDTMSRARIISTMPKLVKNLHKHGWLDYKGYHKIATNTFPNLAALLTGKKHTTITELCKSGMDNCNNIMIWSKFSNLGYTTAFGEDNLRLPDTFSIYNGFKTPPTHHYMRPFFLTGEYQQGNLICAKHQSSAKHILDYAYDFMNAYDKEKFFGTFWMNSVGHNVAYLPSLHEEDTINFFEKIRRSRASSNTFILFLSDHGIRFGPSRMQMQSYYDQRLPMLFIWVPKKFRILYEEQYRNMQLNQNRLITPYDVYLTLAKLSDMSTKSSDLESEACPRCNNLFQEKSPSSTCTSSGVNEKWCSCHSMSNADTFTDLDALHSVEYAISYLQNYTLTIQTQPYTACYPILPQKIYRVHSYTNGQNQKSYVIALQMVAAVSDKEKREPPKMSYEITVVKEGNTFSLLPIDTIDSYDSETRCIINKRDYGLCLCKYLSCFRRRVCSRKLFLAK